MSVLNFIECFSASAEIIIGFLICKKLVDYISVEPSFHSKGKIPLAYILFFHIMLNLIC